MNRYPLWKYLVLIIAIVIGVLYALPNVFGEDPSVQITPVRGAVETTEIERQAREVLDEEGKEYIATEVDEERVLIRFRSSDAQVDAADLLRARLGNDVTVALNLAPATPDWLRAINAAPMYLGLDLRGGVHFLMDVDMDAAVTQSLERYQTDFRNQLRQERIRYGRIEVDDDNRIVTRFNDAADRERAYDKLRSEYRELDLAEEERDGQYWLIATVPDEEKDEIQRFAVQQNITTLRNRVNELGVAEPVIQQQGTSRIVVQLPGVQDTARAREIIGTTATLEFRMVDEDHYPYRGEADDPAPPGTVKYPARNPRYGDYVVMEREVMLTGEYIIDASSGIDQETGGPEVNIRLSSAGGDMFNRATRENVGNSMAVVFIETRQETREEDGESVTERVRTEEVINVATIQEPLSNRFRITGLEDSSAARDLALLLRAGSLAAPIDIIEERTVGPSMGQENIDRGVMAVVIGFVLVVLFMAFYYRVFGLIANMALMLNLVFIVAVLSMLQATLTLPGIAGIVLTVGMAVDANVLIFQRIREEIAAGLSPQQAIHSGYAKALSTIADANITTLIAAVVLFLFGSGPIQGFAVTLSIGIVTSMFTAILGTRAVVNLIYGRKRRLTRLAI
ncbi:protein translocase subunit SecD [Aquisalimonas asiatica]|uniref:Protein translocase subunit SecD n=1 Tax=Aquisalimonas asiatica TaxID=406100 RepID=A0A1H8PLT4_9GAMM|nr:protein translocase subunit SecD [Aquisalimonas asiatica]SEO42678.1 preprotein translocase subunit SecD [Aquisalimonas asiatica]